MRRLFSGLYILFISVLLLACHSEDELQPVIEICEIDTEYFAQFSLVYSNQNLIQDPTTDKYGAETACWENMDPYSISSGGEGSYYEDDWNYPGSYLAFTITAIESIPENTMPPYYKRYLQISVPFAINDFETQEKFYGLLKEGSYEFAESMADYGSIAITYWVDDKFYSSLGNDNAVFDVTVTDLVELKPEFNSPPAGNNGVPASVEATFSFSALLRSEDGEYLLVENAKIRGRYYRQSPSGYYWEDWGKGWEL